MPSWTTLPATAATSNAFVATILREHGIAPALLDALEGYIQTLPSLRAETLVYRPLSTQPECRAGEIQFETTAEYEAIRPQLVAIAAQFPGHDITLQENSVFRRNKRLVVFDMDSTLIQQEVIDEIAKHAGVVEQVSRITESAMNGEIDFKESLRQRVALLKGIPSNVFEHIKTVITFTPGAHRLCKALKRLGFKLAVISGGFMPLATYVKNELGLDYAFANQLKISEDGTQLTGETFGPVVDGARKADLLLTLAQANGLINAQVIAVGDGANDLLMMAEAGLGVAFNAKPRVQAQAQARINQTSLENVLYFLGYNDAEIAALVAN